MDSDNMKEIEFTQKMSFYCNDKSISQMIWRLDSPLWNNFKIDCVNNKIIPDNGFDINNYESNCEIYNKAVCNVLKEEMEIDKKKFDKFLDEFKKLELTDSNRFFTYDRTFVNTVAVTDSNGWNHMFLIDFPEKWFKLGELLNDLVGFDILNIEASKYLITNLYYDFKRDGVYDKFTNKKLKLKSLTYRHGPVLNIMNLPRITINFEEKKINGCFQKEGLSGETMGMIFNLLERYHIYELDYNEFWQKDIHHPWVGLDGYQWELSLVFEDGKHWMIGDHNKYPDIFVHLAKEVIELTGTDILNLKAIDNEHLKLYEVYGDKILKKH